MVCELQVFAARAQERLTSVPYHQWVLPDGTLWAEFHRLDDTYVVRFPELADFELSADASSIRCAPMPGISEESVHHLYLNQVMPLALSRRGHLVLHASAVDFAGYGIAFLGPSGRGKSTLAVGFGRAGTVLLTDDGLVLEDRDGGAWVLPSHPSVRLWSDSEAELIPPGALRFPAADFSRKNRFLGGDDLVFATTPRQLRCAYLLGDASTDEIRVEKLGARESLIALVTHSFLLEVRDQDTLSRQFEALASLVDGVFFFRLDYPRRYDRLPDVQASLSRHISELLRIA